MSGSTEVAKDFATPDRGTGVVSTKSSQIETLEEKKEVSRKEAASEHSTTVAPMPNTVTPADHVSRDDSDGKLDTSAQSPLQIVVNSQVDSPEDPDKQVRFDGERQKGEVDAESPAESPASTNSNSQRGLVSRRGGRCASPGRIPSKPPVSKEAILEFKTFRSPQRKRDENDTVPSLCSINSGLDNKEKKTVPEAAALKVEEAPQSKTEDHHDQTSPKENENDSDRKPSSISCDSSLIETTSPLASHEADQAQDAKASQHDAAASRMDESQARRANVTFSPPPPSKEHSEKPIKTPTKSPSGGHFQSLPSLDDATLKSPVGIFLSPHPPTPSNYRTLPEDGCFDKSDEGKEHDKLSETEEKLADEDDDKFPKSPKTRDQERERFVATPTDFTTDYGKGHPNSGSFDTSNVLAWLQSPTANGLFSPGGLGSIMNTPRGAPSLGGTGPRTPRTPTVSTSFFFSDVAGLPRSGEFTSPKVGSNEAGKRGGSQRGYSNIICISPLASTKGKNGALHHGNTPINYKDVFASPAEKNHDSLPLLGDSPASGVKARVPHRTASRDPSLDAVHMAERDLMEDEDLSVLLQLASNTPRSTGDRPAAVSSSDGTHVFRSPTARKNGSGGDENLPALQLPMIGGRDGEGNGARLARKTHSRDHNETSCEFGASSIGIRPSSSGPPKDMFLGKSKDSTATSNSATASDKRKQVPQSDAKKSNKKSTLPPAPPPYSMPPPPYPHPGADVPYYPPPPMPGMPPSGSMRVVVGGPPPTRPPKTSPSHSKHAPGSPHDPRRYPMGPGDPNYPPPPYPPPPGHYPHHPVPPPHMPHPYHSHYPPHHHPTPRPHMPMYGAQHPPAGKAKSSKKTKQAKTPKPGTKRPAPPASSRPANVAVKKPKKSSPSAAPKKKNKSPQLTDRGDRQKAAAAIQAVNVASGGKNDRAAALAAAILRGVTMRPSGKWQAQLYFAGKSRYIGVFDTREKAALAYEIAREKLKSEKLSAESGGGLSPKATEAAVNAARKAAFEGVNERDPRLPAK